MKAILIDVAKCTGCEKCVEACVETNALAERVPYANRSSDGLSGRRYTSLQLLPEEHFVRKMCLHCLEPGCVNACIVGALEKTEAGPVVYDPEKCIGCRYCMLACPMSIPRYEWEKTQPYIQKCSMCVDRLRDGKAPACVDACEEEACVFGERDDLIRRAHETIAAHPDVYVPHVYGEHEFGGTSVLYISDVELDVLGWPEQVGERTISSYTWPLISKTPLIAFGVASFLTGTVFIINRRMKLQDEAVRKGHNGERGNRDDESPASREEHVK